MKGKSSMVQLTPSGEVAVFVGDVSQLEPGETEDACVAFSASMIWHSVQPGKQNPYTPEDVDKLADNWYAKLTGSIDNSNGLSLDQLHTMLDGMGLKWEDIPLSHNASDDDKVRAALRAGKPVCICAAESSFFDVQLGRVPYQWDTTPFNHCLVATGLTPDGVNVYVRDTVEVGQAFPPASQRVYDLGKMQYVSLTAVIPSWLTNGGHMGLPNGAKDDGSVITFSNGHKMRMGFASKYRQMCQAGSVPSDDMALEDEHAANPVEQSNPTWWVEPGTAQVTRYFRFGWSRPKGVLVTFIGQEFQWYVQQYNQLKSQPQPPPTGGVPDAIKQGITALQGMHDQERTIIEQLAKDVGL